MQGSLVIGVFPDIRLNSFCHLGPPQGADLVSWSLLNFKLMAMPLTIYLTWRHLREYGWECVMNVRYGIEGVHLVMIAMICREIYCWYSWIRHLNFQFIFDRFKPVHELWEHNGARDMNSGKWRTADAFRLQAKELFVILNHIKYWYDTS